MRADLDGAGHVPCLWLTGRLCIGDVAAAHPTLLDAVARHPDLQFDLAGIEALDAAGMQLLVHCKRAAIARGHRLAFVGHSEVVVELVQLFNLAGELGDPLLLRADAPEATW